jgi:acyl carrier protein
MADSEIFDFVKNCLVTYIGVDPTTVTPDADLVSDFELDSFDLIELIMIVEEKYNIEVNERDMTKVSTIQDMIDVIKKVSK